MPQIKLNTLLELVGELIDDSEAGSASNRFRKYLQENVKRANDVRDYVTDALAQSGSQYNKALQDLINHVGDLLGFDVTFGRYRGVRNEIGFDGLWRSPTRRWIVIEVKTTDVYTVKTATLLGYINALVSDGTITDPGQVLGLYVYGRFDSHTNQMENAILAESRREQLRVVSVEALLNLLELQQDYDLSHSAVLGLLHPSPTRVDALVNLIFDIVAQEKQEGTAFDDAMMENADEPIANEQHADLGSGGEQTTYSLIALEDTFSGRSIRAVIFQKKRHEVRTWKEAALVMFEILRSQHQKNFETVAVSLVGRKRPYITADKDRLRKPELIPNTHLYYETNLSANSIAKLCYTLIIQVGYGQSSLRFELEP